MLASPVARLFMLLDEPFPELKLGFAGLLWASLLSIRKVYHLVFYKYFSAR